LQVIRPAIPAGRPYGRALAHQLGQHDAQQDACVERGQHARAGHRAVDAAGVDRDVQQRQPLLGQVDALLQGFLVGDQAGGDVDVAGGEGAALERLNTAGDNLAHLHRRHATLEVR